MGSKAVGAEYPHDLRENTAVAFMSTTDEPPSVLPRYLAIRGEEHASFFCRRSKKRVRLCPQTSAQKSELLIPRQLPDQVHCAVRDAAHW